MSSISFRCFQLLICSVTMYDQTLPTEYCVEMGSVSYLLILRLLATLPCHQPWYWLQIYLISLRVGVAGFHYPTVNCDMLLSLNQSYNSQKTFHPRDVLLSTYCEHFREHCPVCNEMDFCWGPDLGYRNAEYWSRCWRESAANGSLMLYAMQADLHPEMHSLTHFINNSYIDNSNLVIIHFAL